MAELKSSKDKIKQATGNLNPDKNKPSNENQVVISLLQEQGGTLKKIQRSLSNKLNEDENNETVGSLKQSVGYLTSITGKLEGISTTVSSLTSVVSPIAEEMNTTISLLGSIKTSLMQITGVLSAFRADYIMTSNGVTPRGESYINKQMITADLKVLASLKTAALKQTMQIMRSAGNYADLMSNAVRAKIGNTKMAKEGDGQGLFGKLLGKLSPDMAEIGGAFAPFLQAFGIDDTNIKTLMSSVLGKEKTKTVIDPLNELIGSLMNSPDTGKGINAKKMLAGWINEKTGFGDDTKKFEKEKDPNLVMSALAPFADDIKQIVESEYKALSARPNKIPIYATPVWVVNSETQVNYFEKNPDNMSGGVRGTQMILEKMTDLLSGNNTNTRTKEGNSLGSFNAITGEMEGPLFDEYLKSAGLGDADYNTKFMHIKDMQDSINQQKRKNFGHVKENYVDANGQLQQREVATIFNTLNDLSSNGAVDDLTSIGMNIMNVIGGFQQGGIMGAAFSGIGGLADGSFKKAFSKDERSRMIQGVRGMASQLHGRITEDMNFNKNQRKATDAPTYFALMFNEEIKKYFGLNDNDPLTTDMENLIKISVSSLNFQNENTLMESMANDKLKQEIEKIFPNQSEEILSIIFDCAEKVFNQEPEKSRIEKLTSKAGKKVLDLLKNIGGETHHSGRGAKRKSSKKGSKKKNSKKKGKKSSSLVEDFGPAIVEDSDTVVPKNKVDSEVSEEREESAILAGMAGSIGTISVIAANMNEDFIRASNGEKVDGKHKHKFNPIRGILSIFSKTKASKEKVGGKAVKALNSAEKDSDISKDVKVKQEAVKGKERKTMGEDWDKDEKEQDKPKSFMDKFKDKLEKKFNKGKKKFDKKLKNVFEEKFQKNIKEAKHLSEGMQRIKNGIGAKTENFRKKVNNLADKAIDKGVNLAFKGAKTVGKGILGAGKLAGKGILGAGKLIGKGLNATLGKTKIGGKALGGVKKIGGFIGNKIKARHEKNKNKTGILGKLGNLTNKIGKKLGGETNAEKREREKTEALQKQNEAELKAAKENAEIKKKAENERQKELDKANQNIINESEKNEQDIADKRNEAVDDEIKQRRDSNEAIEKAKEDSEKTINATQEGAEQTEAALENAAVQTQITIENSGATAGAALETTGGATEASASASSGSPLTLPMGLAIAGGAAALIGGIAAKFIKSIKKGKEIDPASANSATASVSKNSEKEAKKAKKAEEKRKKKEEKERRKQERKERRKNRLKSLIGRTPLGIFTREKVYVDQDGTIKKKKDNEPVKLREKDVDTEENLNIKTKEGKKQFLKRIVKGEFKLVKNPNKSSLQERKEKINKNKNDEIDKVASADNDKTKQNEDISKSETNKKINGMKSNNKMAKIMQLILISSSPMLFMGAKMKKKMDQLLKSSFGQMLMNKPEEGSNILFNVSGGGTALNLSNSSNGQLSKLVGKTGSAISSLFSNIFSKLFKNEEENDKKGTSTNLADGSYSENATMAYSEYQSRLSNNKFLSSFSKSLGLLDDMEFQKDDNGNELTTSQIVDKERKQNSLQLLVSNAVNTISGNNTTNTAGTVKQLTTSNGSYNTSGMLASDFFLQTLKNSSISSHIYRDNGAFHGGTDFAAPEGTEIYTPTGGTVTRSSLTEGISESMGHFVCMKGNDGKYYRFMHMVSAPVVGVGDTVKVGQLIGYVGTTGDSSGNHLHVDISNKDSSYGTSGISHDDILDTESYVLTGKGKRKKLLEEKISPDITAYGKRSPYHIYQRDFNGISYNKKGDTQYQTLGDSGCGPASAAVVKNIYGKGKKFFKSGKYGKGYTVNSSSFPGNSVEEKFWRFMIANGCSKEWTAGIMGNIKRESGFNPFVKEGGETSNSVPYSGGGYGLIQWTGADYQRSADECCKMLTNNAYGLNSMEGQFVLILATAICSPDVLSFGDGMCSYAAQCLKNAGGLSYANSLSVQDACILWEEQVERAGVVAMEDRIAFAQDFFDRFSKGDFSGGTSLNMASSSGSTATPSNTGSINASSLGSLGTLSLQTDSYVDGSVLEKYLNKKSSNENKSTDNGKNNTNTPTQSNNSRNSTATPSNSKSQTTDKNSDVLKTDVVGSPGPITNYTPTNNSTSQNIISQNENQISPENITNINNQNGNSLVINNINNNSSNGSIVICNNYDEKITMNVDEIISNFKHLNSTQRRALDVLKEISKLINDDDNKTNKEPRFILGDDGLDLLLKGL